MKAPPPPPPPAHMVSGHTTLPPRPTYQLISGQQWYIKQYIVEIRSSQNN